MEPTITKNLNIHIDFKFQMRSVEEKRDLSGSAFIYLKIIT